MPYEQDDADEEWVDEDDSDDSDDDLLACPSCKKAVHEDTQKCPYCGDWVTPVSLEQRSKRMVWVLVILLMIVLLIVVTIL